MSNRELEASGGKFTDKSYYDTEDDEPSQVSFKNTDGKTRFIKDSPEGGKQSVLSFILEELCTCDATREDAKACLAPEVDWACTLTDPADRHIRRICAKRVEARNPEESAAVA